MTALMALEGFSLSGCQSLSLFSSPIQKRGVSGFFKDNLLRAKITKAIFRQYTGSLSFLIHRGRVFLVGYLQNEEEHQKILNTLGGFKEIQSLKDYLVVGRAPDDPLKDTYLSQSMQSALFFDARLRSQNYHITVSHRVLYVLGTSSSEGEKQAVLKHAEPLKVRGVVSDITVEKEVGSTVENGEL